MVFSYPSSDMGEDCRPDVYSYLQVRECLCGLSARKCEIMLFLHSWKREVQESQLCPARSVKN